MAAILNLAEQLLALARTHITRFQNAQAVRILNRLLALPDLAPRIAAEANLLLAQAQLEHADYDDARRSLGAAIDIEPDNSQCHFLLGQANELDGGGDAEEALDHYAQAARLDPNDARKTSTYARKLSQYDNPRKGLKLLQKTYAEHGNDPLVVEDFVESLIEADKIADAELVVAQAAYRNAHDPRFGTLRRRFQDRLRCERLLRSSTRPGRARPTVPYRNFSTGGPMDKPRSPKRPSPRSDRPASVPTTPVSRSAIVTLGEELSLAQVLKKLGTHVTRQLYDQLGLIGKARPHLQRAQIVKVLADRSFLNSLVKRLPMESRRLLRTVVRSGGYVPANVLFQITGPDAPPPDYVQPLMRSGLLYFGKRPGNARDKDESLIAVIPIDLLGRLAGVLKINVGD